MWLRKNFDPFKPFDIRLRFSPSQRYVGGVAVGTATALSTTAPVAAPTLTAGTVAAVAPPTLETFAAANFALNPMFTSTMPLTGGAGLGSAMLGAPAAGLGKIHAISAMLQLGGLVSAYGRESAPNPFARSPLLKETKELLGKKGRPAETITERLGGGRGGLKVTERPATESTGLIGRIEKESADASRGRIGNLALPLIGQARAIGQEAELGAAAMSSAAAVNDNSIYGQAITGNTLKGVGMVGQAQFEGGRGISDAMATEMRSQYDRSEANKFNLMQAETFRATQNIRRNNANMVSNAERQAGIGQAWGDAFSMAGLTEVYDAVEKSRSTRSA